MRRFGRTGGLDGAVVTQDADQLAMDPGVATHHLRGVAGLELQEIRCIHQTGNHLAHIVGFALVRRNNAHELLLVIQRLLPVRGRSHRVPAQLVHHLARHGDSVGIVFTEVLPQASDLRMGFSSTQFVLRTVLADSGLDQWRACQKDIGAPSHQNHVVRKAWQIGAAGSGRSMHYRNLRQARSRHARLVGKAAAAIDKNFCLVQQIGAATLHQVDHGKFVLLGNLLRPQGLAQAHGRHRSALDSAVVHRDQTALARHHANAHDRAATEHRLFAIVVVHLQARKAAEFQKRRAPVQEPRQAFARQQLLALGEFGALGLGFGNHLGLKAVDLVQQRRHALGVGGKGGRAGVELGAQGGGTGHWGHEH